MRERRNVFGEVADDYDRIRPGYPAALADDLLAAAGGGPVLEVGAGTGKATVLFDRPGVELICLEPDTRMAAVLRHKLPAVTVLETPFEDWRPDRGYRLLISAQAWHWIDPDRRADLAWAALAPGGLFAPFWNVFGVADPALHAALAEVDARHGLTDQTAHRLAAAARQPLDAFEREWPQLGLTDGRFTDLTSRRYTSTLSYSTDRYRAYLLSTSLYRLLDPAQAGTVLDDAAAVIEAHGGVIEFSVCTDVAFARRAGGPVRP